MLGWMDCSFMKYFVMKDEIIEIVPDQEEQSRQWIGIRVLNYEYRHIGAHDI